MKSPLRTFNGRGGTPGQVFHCELLDAEGGEIRASFFGSAVDKFFGVLEVGKVYCLSKGTVKVANRQYNTCNHRYELTFDKDALVEAAVDDTGIKQETFNFLDLRALQTKPVPCRVDLCVVVTAYKEMTSIRTKDDRELLKREITVADDSATTFDITLFGDWAK